MKREKLLSDVSLLLICLILFFCVNYAFWELFARARQRAVALYRQAGIFNQEKKYDQAAALLDKALEWDDNLGYVYTRLGWTYIQMREWDRAEAASRRALQVDINRANKVLAYWNLGRLSVGRGRYAEAVSHLEKGLELDSADAWSYQTLGYAREKMGELEAGIKNYRKVIELDNDQDAKAWALYRLGWVLNRIGEQHSAEAALEQLLKIRPDFIDNDEKDNFYDPHMVLSLVYRDQGRCEDALAEARISGRVNPSGASDYYMALAQLCAKRVDLARKSAEILRQKHPGLARRLDEMIGSP